MNHIAVISSIFLKGITVIISDGLRQSYGDMSHNRYHKFSIISLNGILYKSFERKILVKTYNHYF